jgi:hypothetical protein
MKDKTRNILPIVTPWSLILPCVLKNKKLLMSISEVNLKNSNNNLVIEVPRIN